MAEPALSPTLHVRRLLSATPQEVFEAWIDPEGVRTWMCPEATTLAEVRLDVRVGGQFCIVMRGESGDLVHTGEYREIQPPRKLVFTWRSAGTHEKETLVTVELYPRGNKTELVLTHAWLPDETAIEKHAHGWRSIVEKLAAHLSR
ncbi:MAG: SRPBCC domain-containing protein [Deltaproteobacteria bacterium]|nr:SRPBCC domain-containing protein [Deltaproteobacteria bacterium]